MARPLARLLRACSSLVSDASSITTASATSSRAMNSAPWNLGMLRSMTTSPEKGATKYYDSQSGRWMSVPGAAGIRVHEKSLAAWNPSAMPLRDRLQVLDKLLAAQPYSVELWEGAVEEMKRVRWTNDTDVKLVTRVEKPEHCDPEMHRVVQQVVHGVRCDSPTFKEDLQLAKAVVREAVDAGLQVRAYVLNAFEGGEDEDNLNLPMAQEAVMSMADFGAELIILSDCRGKAHEDSLRELVEEAFYLDVVGDTMLERLGVSASLEICRLSARLGVQHFDACLGVGAAGRVATAIPHTCELLAMLAEEGKKCSMDSDFDTLLAPRQPTKLVGEEEGWLEA
eukprot:gene13974-19917_t